MVLFTWPFRSRGESAAPPPTSTSIAASDSRVPSSHQGILSRLTPANHVVLTRGNRHPTGFFPGTSGSVKGTYAIDPYLHTPRSFLSPFSPINDGPNLLLEVENGGIDADIYLVGDASSAEGSGRTLRTTLHLSVDHRPRPPQTPSRHDMASYSNAFPLIAKIHTPVLSRPPFYLSATAVLGYLCVHLPRSFHGLITVKREIGDINHHVTISRELTDHLTVLVDEGDTTRRYFVGEVGGWMEGNPEQVQGWRGDEVDLKVGGGKIRIQFENERGFFGRVWKRTVSLL